MGGPLTGADTWQSVQVALLLPAWLAATGQGLPLSWQDRQSVRPAVA